MTRIISKLEIKSWDENTSLELGEGSRFTTANVTLAPTDELELSGTMQSVMYYPDEANSTYIGIMHLTGRLGDRTGGFVLKGDGRYGDGTARSEMEIVPGSGTGDFAGIRGTAVSVSTHADYPYMPIELDYELG